MTLEKVILFLENSKTNEMYKFFERGKCKYGFKLDHPLIKKFIKDENKIILMALAKFSHDFDTVKYLYENSKEAAIRIAALSNDKQHFDVMFYTFLGITPEIKKINDFLKKASTSEIKAYFGNKNFRENHILDFLDKKIPFDNIEEEKYKLILLYLLKNPNRLSKYGPGNFPLDGFTFAENHRVSEEFPKVFKKYFPKTLYELNKLHEV